MAIDGVTILNTVEVIERGREFPIWSIPCIVLLIIGLIFSCSSDKSYYWVGGLVSFVMSLVLVYCYSEGRITARCNQYEALITNEASFVEILNAYDFVAQRGDIYVLRDKEPKL